MYNTEEYEEKQPRVCSISLDVPRTTMMQGNLAGVIVIEQ